MERPTRGRDRDGPEPAAGALPPRELVEAQLDRGGVVLRFVPELEAAFLNRYLATHRSHMRMSLLVGLGIFGSFGLLDAALFPGLRPTMWALRYGVACPAVVVPLVMSVRTGWGRGVQVAYAAALFAVGCVLTAMMRLDPAVAVMYYPSLILLLIFGYAFSGMQLGYAAASAGATTAVYVLAGLVAGRQDALLFLNNASGLVATNVIGVATGYFLEKYRRRDFLQTVLLLADRRELQAVNERLRELSYCDGLTGIANRRAFEEAFAEEWGRASRHRYPVAVLMIDIDHFKRFNDDLGHQAGDRCLARVASVLRAFGGRVGDLVARYGGEEFVLLLQGTDAAGAARIADEIRGRVGEIRIRGTAPGPARSVTVSVGVACAVPGPGDARDRLVRAADAALYRAKAEGRDRTVVQAVEG